LLTGLVNRREFEARMERALKSAKAREASYALCYLDIDQFKIVNDSCGHGAGDALLGQVGALLKSKVRWRDTLSRLGGDEFGILLDSCSLD
jgi:diguanylate cyclase (GGDEF)-like protein